MLKQLGIVASISLLLCSCAAIEVESQGNHVISSPNPPPKDCKYLGEVIGNQGNFFTGAWTSNKNLEQGARNDLRNQAGKLGANYIQLVTSRAGNSGSYDSASGGSIEQTNVTYTGNAYSCPPKLIGLQ